jgi:hypothetical protein
MENRGGMISAGQNSCFVNQSSIAILSAESFGSKQVERAKGMKHLAILESDFYMP